MFRGLRDLLRKASSIEVAFILGTVIIVALLSAPRSAALATMTGREYGVALLIATYLTAFAFVASCLLVSMSMMLREIALNTRRPIEQAPDVPPVEAEHTEEIEVQLAMLANDRAQAENKARYSAFIDAAAQMSPLATTALMRARELGATVSIKEGTTFIVRLGDETVSLVSNGEIEDLGRMKGWI